MPELPEVETIKRRLQEILPGKVIQSVEVRKDKSFNGKPDELVGLEIQDVSRRAKWIRLHLPNNLNILTHLKMTGQIIYIDDQQRIGGGHPTADWVQELPSGHTRIIYTFTDDSTLYFNDQRIFGWMRVMTDSEVTQEYQRYGPDITDEVVTIEYLQEALSRRTIPIKRALMVNEIVAGVGNIYASDALNVAQISPFREARSLDRSELQRLLGAVREVMAEALELGGTTFDGKYVDVSGLSGGYQHHLKAYGREGERCYQCGGEIVKAKQGGRSTYYCQQCQGVKTV